MSGSIRLRDVSFSYRTGAGEPVPVLKNVSIEIKAGELVAIQGSSGSGKSTLLYIIGGLLSSYSGTVEIGGRDLSDMSEIDRATLRNQDIGFVFQQFYLLPKATVLENVLLPNEYPTESPKASPADHKALSLLRHLSLEDRRDSFPNQLSGGQQQRVSIARALLNETRIILADEPTGSLDTVNSAQIVAILKEANQNGRTVVIITHDPEVARHCHRVIHVRDGRVVDQAEALVAVTTTSDPKPKRKTLSLKNPGVIVALTRVLSTSVRLLPLAAKSLKQNRSRSVLTMIGIVIGVAAVLSMITVGSFTKRKILDSYAEMGVDSLIFYGYPNYELKATDVVSTVFQSFDWDRDLSRLKHVFPEIRLISPMVMGWDGKANFGGKVIDSDVRIVGVSPDGLEISNRKIILGTGIQDYHVEYRSPVCVVGNEIAKRLFSQVTPLGQILYVSQNETSFGCRVIGILAPTSSNKAWLKPNLQIFVPYTFFQGIGNPWEAQIRDVLIEAKRGSNPEKLGKTLKSYFNSKYGKSARFEVGSDTNLISQMNKFLSLFTVLLGAIALVSLTVGGIGITNMMMVSVAERFKEIGIRKAFGATAFSVRIQYLTESVLICMTAGAIGLVIGFVLYEGAIYGATQLVPNLKFEWVFDRLAIALSTISIFAVGLLSGLTPALKAEKLEVIEALRSE